MNDVQTPPDVETSDHLLASKLKFPVVGIGASAGGIGALQKFFEQMPADSGMAFVLIMHLSPKHESNIASILQHVTRMPITQVVETIPLEANHVYVIAPTTDLTMNDGHLEVAEPDRPRGRHVAIDLFFRTLAQVHRERAFAIVLSGTGTDGAVGITRIKELGGITIVQTPEDAEYDGMPRAAIATDMVDFVVPIMDMPQKLLDIWGNARTITLPIEPDGTLRVVPVIAPTVREQAEEALRDVMQLLRARTRHDFRHYKRATVLRRIERRLQVNGLQNLPAYRDFLKEHASETSPLLQDMLISVTNFFRDQDSFDALARDFIPAMFEKRSPNDSLRVWVPGCATGEEAYSVAILLREAMERQSLPPEIQVFATDIDERAIAVARAGMYSGAISTDVSPSRLRLNFSKEGNRFRVAKNIREKVLFAAHSVLRDPPFLRLDLICCRNLLIYLDREAQASILEMFRFALKPDGILFLGSSESADAGGQAFSVVDKKHRIYRSNAGAQLGHVLPNLGEVSAAERRASIADVAPPPERRNAPTWAELHQRALERSLPPSVLIDSNHNVLHLSEGVARYLEHGSGVPSLGLLANVQPELRLELRTALFKASKTRAGADARAISVQIDGAPALVNLFVRPFHNPANDDDLILVIFEEVKDGVQMEASGSVDPASEQLVRQLESEIHRLKTSQQETVEQAETSNEELKASNEELQAINEELRSASEELETSKEELQSINEELITVNYELKVKVEETARVNDDLQNLIASTDIATVFIDAGMRIHRFSPRTTDIFNMIATDIGRSLLDITHRLDYAELAEDAIEVFRTLRPSERPVVSVTGRHYLARILPYRTTEDKIEGAVLTFVDVTQLRAAEARAHAGEQRLQAAAESTKDFLIMTLDNEGLITSWNQGAERSFGWTEREVVGESVAIIFTEEDIAKQAHVHELERARTTGRAEDERWHRRKDNSTFFCSGVMSRLISDDGTGFSKIARDMTDSRILAAMQEAQLEIETASRLKAQAANELKDEFLAVMSHELKHPLNLIHVNAELLVRLPQAREIPLLARSAETIRRAVLGQAKIIDDLLDLSRARTGKLNFNTEPTSIGGIVTTIVGAIRSDAVAKRITLDLEGAGDEILADCDPVRTEQIVWNLLSNAMKFTPTGGRVTVTVAQDARFVRIVVADTGRGIAPEFLPKIFGMFNQESSGASTRVDGGMGIGLALVQELVVAQGGQVQAESEGLGHGATFTIALPRHRASSSRLEEPAITGDSVNGLRVLVVDDSRDGLEAFAMLLEIEGAVVDTAGSGAEALMRLGEGGLDLLISDVGMPVMDGYQLIAEVRRREGMSGIPAIALTGYSRTTDSDRAREAGFDAHLPKPTSIEQIKHVVAEAVAKGRRRAWPA